MSTFISAKIVKDSYCLTSPDDPVGVRLTTMELCYPRYIHSELMTHRMFSRCSASSRAIPIEKMIDSACVIPNYWGKNKAGMQADGELSSCDKGVAETIWFEAMLAAKNYARQLAEIGVHKQTANRLLEPFSLMHTVVTSTEWENFFSLRISPLAQPEMLELAICMREALNTSCPDLVEAGCWHTPYVTFDEESFVTFRIKRSVARCARVSYNLHGSNQRSTLERDVELFNRLVSSKPMHASPLEHVAIPLGNSGFCRNFRGWKSLRVVLEEGEIVPGFVVGED